MRRAWWLVCCAFVACAPSLAQEPGPLAAQRTPPEDDYAGRAHAASMRFDLDEIRRVSSAWLAAEPANLRARVMRLLDVEDGYYSRNLLYALASSPEHAATHRSRIAKVVHVAEHGHDAMPRVVLAQVILEHGHHADALVEATACVKAYRISDEAREVARAIQERATEELRRDAEDTPLSQTPLKAEPTDAPAVERAWLHYLAGDSMNTGMASLEAVNEHEPHDTIMELVGLSYEKSQSGPAGDARVAREFWETRHLRGKPSSMPKWAAIVPSTDRGAESFCLALIRMQLPAAALPHCVRLWPLGMNSQTVTDFIGTLAVSDPNALAKYGLTPESVFAVDQWRESAHAFMFHRAEWLAANGADTKTLAEAVSDALQVRQRDQAFLLSPPMRDALSKQNGILLRAMMDTPSTRRERLEQDERLARESGHTEVADVAREALDAGR